MLYFMTYMNNTFLPLFSMLKSKALNVFNWNLIYLVISLMTSYTNAASVSAGCFANR